MCISCGCGKFEDSHGDERNITVASLQRAANASEMRLDQVVQAMIEGCEKLASSPIPDHQSAGQAVEERLHPD